MNKEIKKNVTTAKGAEKEKRKKLATKVISVKTARREDKKRNQKDNEQENSVKMN